MSYEASTTSVFVNARMVRRILTKAGIKGRIPRKKPWLNKKQQQKRIQWAKKQRLTDGQWKQLIWSDTIIISTFANDERKCVRYPENSNLNSTKQGCLSYDLSSTSPAWQIYF